MASPGSARSQISKHQNVENKRCGLYKEESAIGRKDLSSGDGKIYILFSYHKYENGGETKIW